MSFTGVKVKTDTHEVSAKLHGPQIKLLEEPSTLRIAIKKYLFDEPTNMVDNARDLVDYLVHRYVDGTEVVWVEVTIESIDGLLFNAVGELNNV